jgi:leucyl aminopeptidase
MIVSDAIKNLFCCDDVIDSIAIDILREDGYEAWLARQDSVTKQQLLSQKFAAHAGEIAVLVDSQGHVSQVCAGSGVNDDFWLAGAWVKRLPKGVYHLHTSNDSLRSLYALAWGLGAYKFSRYLSKSVPCEARLLLPKHYDHEALFTMLASIYWVRDLINTPAQDMMPTDMVDEAKRLAKFHKATCKVLSGDKLLSANYPAVHAVGRGSMVPPQVIDIRWGKSHLPRLTLIGKGVCFDTGGLDIKSAAGMLQMKKDMGGAAHALALAHLVMSHQLPVCLRLLIPTVENAISDKAYHPGDVINTRQGLTVEVGNTDAEGRLILADVLTEASSENPDLLIDFATLTGAQRIALGEDLPAYFTGDAKLIQMLMEHANKVSDPAWPLPLYMPYKQKLKSPIADLNNITTGSSFGGAITAALFLSHFVGDIDRWIHVDFNAWNETDKAGRAVGGEAMALRMIFSYLQTRYGTEAA